MATHMLTTKRIKKHAPHTDMTIEQSIQRSLSNGACAAPQPP